MARLGNIVKRTILAGATLALANGCVTSTVSSQPAGPTKVVVRDSAAQPFKGDAIAAIDPCADQMQDLCGALLLYFITQHHGPERIDELKAYADPDQTLVFTCPVSHKSYLCSPAGMEAPGRNLRIYIYDAEPSHGGARWCAVSKNGAATGAPAFFAEKIPESVFRLFVDPSKDSKKAAPAAASDNH